MPQHIWDVAVIGSGPAGAAAARAAAQAGARTVLLERAELPRYKRCGGGIIGLSAQLTGLDLEGLTVDHARDVRITWSGNWAINRSDPQPLIPLVMRAELDQALAVSAQQAGAELRTGVVVTAAGERRGHVALTVRDGSPLHARTVVAADGVSSRIAASLGVHCDQVDLGLEGEFARPAGYSGALALDWGPLPGAYGWLFPKGDTVTVGVIGAREQAAGLRRYYADLCRRLGLGPALIEGGHHTRVRSPGSPLCSPGGRILLAGDAAGLLEPWTREGISFALRSGRLAGESAAAGDGLHYPARVEEVLGPEMRSGAAFLRAFSRHPGVFHAAFATPPGWAAFRALMSGRSSMSSLARHAPVRAAIRLCG